MRERETNIYCFLFIYILFIICVFMYSCLCYVYTSIYIYIYIYIIISISFSFTCKQKVSTGARRTPALARPFLDVHRVVVAPAVMGIEVQHGGRGGQPRFVLLQGVHWCNIRALHVPCVLSDHPKWILGQETESEEGDE